MNTPHTVFQNHPRVKAPRTFVVFLIAGALVGICARPTLLTTSSASVQTTVVLDPRTAPMLIEDLTELVKSFNLPKGSENSLVTKLQDALAALEGSDTATACVHVSSFISECEAQSGKKLTADQASQLINSAAEIKTELGCLGELKFNLKETVQ